MFKNNNLFCLLSFSSFWPFKSFQSFQSFSSFSVFCLLREWWLVKTFQKEYSSFLDFSSSAFCPHASSCGTFVGLLMNHGWGEKIEKIAPLLFITLCCHWGHIQASAQMKHQQKTFVLGIIWSHLAMFAMHLKSNKD